jgi:hypothetical protein
VSFSVLAPCFYLACTSLLQAAFILLLQQGLHLLELVHASSVVYPGLPFILVAGSPSFSSPTTLG